MNQSSDSPDPKRQSGVFPVMTPIKVGGQVAFITLFIVFLALFGGLALDRFLDTKPIFTIVLLVGSAPVALYLTFWIAMRAVKDMQSSMPSKPSSAARANFNDEEEE
jgi:F0F1-type ATP synthase assembly protein I